MERKDVEYAAWLARLELSEEEAEGFARQLGKVLEQAEKMVNLDTGDIEPTSHATSLVNVLRPDEVRPCLSQEEALSGAPRVEEGYFMVPRIV